ncbi:MAG: hypothetical protein M3Y18_09685 [Candidatus Eremiobacteraeota bacterium]|nr:hypothetical protein [Candidatus Eremiobacteraeota bacterium]
MTTRDGKRQTGLVLPLRPLPEIAALQAARARGTPLGATNPNSRNLTPETMVRGRALGVEAIKRNARAYYDDIIPVVVELRAGDMSLGQIAKELTTQGYRLRSARLGTPCR